MPQLLTLLALLFFPPLLFAAQPSSDLTGSLFGIAALLIFVIAYGFVIAEDALHLRKSKPVMVAAGIIWVLVALAYIGQGDTHFAGNAVRHFIEEYAELMLFLLAAMTYIATLEERRVFDALRAWLVSRGFSLYTIFWITGLLAFFISPVADNLTTALLMAAVVMAVAADRPKFIAIACVNVVVAANAGGAFSPFGDITTLMVWQKGIIEFHGFFALFLPSLVNWLIPAFLMSLALPKGHPSPLEERVEIKPGGIIVIFLFLGTIATAVLFHSLLHLPPVLGMMTGLGVLKLFGYYLKCRATRCGPFRREEEDSGLGSGHVELTVETGPGRVEGEERSSPFDIFTQLQRAEWDTLMFFYGVILCVGGLGTLGYLALISELMYSGLGATTANILVGVLSAIIDNIPVMFAVLAMNPDAMIGNDGQWLLVTLTAGVGGSLLSIGSAAGVALMGQARGVYTFFSHLRWSWAIALGYGASIAVHLMVNGV